MHAGCKCVGGDVCPTGPKHMGSNLVPHVAQAACGPGLGRQVHAGRPTFGSPLTAFILSSPPQIHQTLSQTQVPYMAVTQIERQTATYSIWFDLRVHALERRRMYFVRVGQAIGVTTFVEWVGQWSHPYGAPPPADVVVGSICGANLTVPPAAVVRQTQSVVTL